MDTRFITQSFYIKDHPVNKCCIDFRMDYLCGLYKLLILICSFREKSKAKAKVNYVFNAWALSITDFDLNAIIARRSNSLDEITSLKLAIKYHRKGFSFYSLRVPFFFDCFYLLEKSGMQNKFSMAYSFLRDKVCGWFSKRELDIVYDYFSNGGHDTKNIIPESLKVHRSKDDDFRKTKPKKVLVVATMNAGKSTLINAIVGQKVNRVSAMACTNAIKEIYNKPSKEKMVICYPNDKLIFTDDPEVAQLDDCQSISLYFNSLLKNSVCFIDSPGVNNSRDKSHREITEEIIRQNEYDALLLISDATNHMTVDESDVLDYVMKHCCKKILFCINKCDCFDPMDDSICDVVDNWKNYLKRYRGKNVEVFALSANAAYIYKKKQSGIPLSSMESQMLKLYDIKFSDPYYYLDNYSNIPTKTAGKIGHTGIISLEKSINNI